MKKLFLLLLLSISFANSSVVELTDKNFESRLKENNKSIVMFSAPWCGACKKMKPDYLKSSKNFEGKVEFFLIDTDEEEKISTKYGIKSIPTTIIFEKGKEVKRNVGSLDMVEIEMFIEPSKMIKEQHQKCMDGKSSSCIQLAGFYKGYEDYNKTLAYYKKSCEIDADGCAYVADIYYYGKIVKEDYVQAALFYEKACRGGDVYGCNHIGLMYDRGEGVALNHEKSAKFYTKACQGKNVWGCTNLGYSYYKGEGVKKDYAKALNFYTLACDRYFSYDSSGSANACNQIGQIYRNGYGVIKDYEIAFKYYGKSCTKGDAIGCSNLGDMYKDGLGVEKNITKSIKVYEKSCEENGMSSCKRLANLYYDGEKVTQNYDKAQQYFEKLCNNEDGYGCYSLGYMHEYGDGSFSMDNEEALPYYKKACRLGYKDACKSVKDLKEEEKFINIFTIVFVIVFYILFIVLHYRQKRVLLENKEFGVTKEVPFLFSWTMFLFGFWIPLFRADFIWSILSLILSLITGGFGTMILAFFYNKMYIKDLLSKGYDPIDDEAKALLDSKGIKYELHDSSKKVEKLKL